MQSSYPAFSAYQPYGAPNPYAQHVPQSYYQQTPYANNTQLNGYPFPYAQNPQQYQTPYEPSYAQLHAQQQPGAVHGMRRPPMTPVGQSAPPLRSAMKPQAQANGLPKRKRYHDPPMPEPVTNPIPPPRTTSIQRSNPLDTYQSIHMFLTFRGTSELVLEHIAAPALVEIRKTVFNGWSSGLEYDEHKGFKWRVKFRNSPWDSNGVHIAEAWQMIISLFTLFAKRGYAFQTLINVSFRSPRLIFLTAPIPESCAFFLAYFSHRGRKVTFIQPPYPIRTKFHDSIHGYFPDSVNALEDNADGLLSFELKRKAEAAFIIDPSSFLLIVLRICCDLGFDLELSIPMARTLSLGAFGIGRRIELFVFKGNS